MTCNNGKPHDRWVSNVCPGKTVMVIFLFRAHFSIISIYCNVPSFTLPSLEKELKALKDKVNKLELQNQSQTKQIDDAKEKLKELQSQLDNAHREMEEYSKIKQKKQDEINNYKIKLDEMTSKVR